MFNFLARFFQVVVLSILGDKIDKAPYTTLSQKRRRLLPCRLGITMLRYFSFRWFRKYEGRQHIHITRLDIEYALLDATQLLWQLCDLALQDYIDFEQVIEAL